MSVQETFPLGDVPPDYEIRKALQGAYEDLTESTRLLERIADVNRRVGWQLYLLRDMIGELTVVGDES